MQYSHRVLELACRTDHENFVIEGAGSLGIHSFDCRYMFPSALSKGVSLGSIRRLDIIDELIYAVSQVEYGSMSMSMPTPTHHHPLPFKIEMFLIGIELKDPKVSLEKYLEYSI